MNEREIRMKLAGKICPADLTCPKCRSERADRIEQVLSDQRKYYEVKIERLRKAILHLENTIKFFGALDTGPLEEELEKRRLELTA